MSRRKIAVVVITIILMLMVSNYLTYNIALWVSSIKGAADISVDAKGNTDDNDSLIKGKTENEYGNYRLLFEVINIINNKYIDTVDEDVLMYGAIDGMLDALGDPQTTYLKNDDMNKLLTFLKGSFGGIGVRILETENGITITDVIPGTPAEKKGLQPGDRIFKVEDVDVTGKDVNQVVDLIRGEEGSLVALVVLRPGSEDNLEYSLVREEITFQTVEGDWIKPSMAYIKINQFDGHTGQEFTQVLKGLEETGINGLILDLRDNPGGVLSEALAVSRLLVPEGEIARMVDRNGEVIEEYLSHATPRPYPMVVLINKGSASGSEIVAGALQDRGVAELVGEETYGKATVQHFETFTSGDGMRFTVAKYVTPSGRDLHGLGLIPDHEVEMPVMFYYYRFLSPGILAEGDHGDSVYILQSILKELDYNITLTGFFDENTTRALKDFQNKKGLSIHGRFDDMTWIKLRKSIDDLAKDKDMQLNKAIELLEER